MTSTAQNIQWTHPSLYSNKVQWTKSTLNYNSYDQQSYVKLRRSRKGTHLNIPEAFYAQPMKQQYIGMIPVLPTGGCSDMEYVLLRQNAFNKKIISSKQNQTYCNKNVQYTPSVTINIGTPPPCNYPYLYPGCQQTMSYSTISINPSIVTEEPWLTQKNVIPLGLHCCEQKGPCEHTRSKEQRVVNLDISENPENDKRLVYVTSPPTISPLKSCWKFLTCKRKKSQGDTYLPTMMTKYERKHDYFAETDNGKTGGLPNKNENQVNFVPSKLSTITESDVTVSEYSSEEFSIPANKQKEKQPENTSRRRILGESSYISDMYTKSFNYPEKQIHRWICEPTKDKKKNKQYVCYKEP